MESDGRCFYNCWDQIVGWKGDTESATAVYLKLLCYVWNFYDTKSPLILCKLSIVLLSWSLYYINKQLQFVKTGLEVQQIR